jgi:hypothetical protein
LQAHFQRFSSRSLVAYAQRNVTARRASERTICVVSLHITGLGTTRTETNSDIKMSSRGGEGTYDRFLNAALYEARNTSFQSLVLPVRMRISTGASGGVHRALHHWLAAGFGCVCRTTVWLQVYEGGPRCELGRSCERHSALEHFICDLFSVLGCCVK